MSDSPEKGSGSASGSGSSRGAEPRKKRGWASWSKDETRVFFQTLLTHGRDFDVITKHVQSKTREQVRHFFYRSLKKINKLLAPLGRRIDGKADRAEGVNALECYWQLNQQAVAEEGSSSDAASRPGARGRSARRSPDAATARAEGARLLELIDRTWAAKQAAAPPATRAARATRGSRSPSSSSSVSPPRPPVAVEPAPAEPRHEEPKVKLQLIPRELSQAMDISNAGHNPRLQLIVQRGKTLGAILEHLAAKWVARDGRSLLEGPLRLYPPALASHAGWGAEAAASTVAELQSALVRLGVVPAPDTLRVEYAWLSPPTAAPAPDLPAEVLASPFTHYNSAAVAAGHARQSAPAKRGRPAAHPQQQPLFIVPQLQSHPQLPHPHQHQHQHQYQPQQQHQQHQPAAHPTSSATHVDADSLSALLEGDDDASVPAMPASFLSRFEPSQHELGDGPPAPPYTPGKAELSPLNSQSSLPGLFPNFEQLRGSNTTAASSSSVLMLGPAGTHSMSSLHGGLRAAGAQDQLPPDALDAPDALLHEDALLEFPEFDSPGSLPNPLSASSGVAGGSAPGPAPVLPASSAAGGHAELRLSSLSNLSNLSNISNLFPPDQLSIALEPSNPAIEAPPEAQVSTIAPTAPLSKKRKTADPFP